MKLATIRQSEGTSVVVEAGDGWRHLEGMADVGALLKQPNWKQVAGSASGEILSSEELDFESVIPAPGKIICVGLNYASHIKEMGRELPSYPTLFAKFAETLTGPFDPVTAVEEDPELDWEGELVVVMGEEAYKVSEQEASSKIAGYCSANDISMRGWQFRTIEWLQGKIWAKSTPLGPVMGA